MTSPVSSSLVSPTASAAADATAPQPHDKQAAPTQTEAAAKVDTVAISDRAAAAQVMLSGALMASAGGFNPALAQLAQDVAGGNYRPPAEVVARSLVRYEGQVAKVSSGLSEHTGAAPTK